MSKQIANYVLQMFARFAQEVFTYLMINVFHVIKDAMNVKVAVLTVQVADLLLKINNVNFAKK